MSIDAKQETGFTLWELLVAMLVVGIVLGIGLPNLLTFRQNNSMVAAVNDFVAALHLSRNEAVKRQLPVTICVSSDPLSSSPACDGGGSGGFFAFVDANLDADGVAVGDGAYDAGETILVQHDDPDGNIVASFDGTYMHYGADGFRTDVPGLGAPFATALFCDERGNKDAGNGESVARVVSTSGTGRPQLLREMSNVTAAVSATGGTCP